MYKKCIDIQNYFKKKYKKMSRAQITQVNVHPLVLLSIVDHFNRVNLKQRSKRVVGALLGIYIGNGVG